MKIFVIGGKAKSGKNTFGEKLKKHLIDYGYKPCIMHITEPLYTYAKNYFMYDAKNDEKAASVLYAAVDAFNAEGLSGDANETAKLLQKLYPQSKQAKNVKVQE